MSLGADATGYTFRQFYIPDRMAGALNLYIDQGIMPGDFLVAVLEHDLFGAVGRADDENLDNLPAFVAFIYNEAPGNCHGSREKVQAWAEHLEVST